MKRIVTGFVVVACGARLAYGDPSQDAALAAQKKFVEAYRTCNVSAMNQIVTDDMQFIHVGGNTQDKAQFVAGVGACGLADLTIDVTKVRMYGETAVLQGNLHYKSKQGPGGMLIVSEVFVKRQGAWQFASHQSTAPQAASK
jgi:ketosteroid isomerase-like protein